MTDKRAHVAVLKRCRQIMKTAPITLNFTMFVGITGEHSKDIETMLDRVEVAMLTSILQMVTPEISILSKHPLQKKSIVGAAWLEDGAIIMGLTIDEKDRVAVRSFARHFGPDSFAAILNRMTKMGRSFNDQYRAGADEVMAAITKVDVKDPPVNRFKRKIG